MARFTRRAVLLLLVLGGVLLLLPAEKMPPTGQWLVRSGLEPRVARVSRENAGGPQGAAGALPPPSLGRLDIRYVRKGQGPTVILIHGLASSIYTWAEVIGPLADRFDVIALDLPGFGGSSQPADLVFDDYAKTMTGLMGALGIQKAHLVGNSLGGAVALLMAARRPDLVDRVVALDSAGFDAQPAERPFIARLLASRTASVLAARLPVVRLSVGATLRSLYQDGAGVTEERIDEYTAPLLRPGALVSARSLLLSPPDERFVADLSVIQAKTLVMWGRFDPWLPESHADRFVAAIPGARKVVLETGHMPQEEKPADVARIIGDFLLS